VTTWQDQQPMSRRALRESERAHAQATLSDTGETEAQKTEPDQQIWSENSIAEPLDYTTQARQPSVTPETPLRRPRQSGSTRPTAESAGYRLRDFGPDSRGNSFSSTQPAPWTPPSAGSEDLSYHTSVEADRPIPESYSAPTSTPPVVVTPADIPTQREATPAARAEPSEEHTLTRREMREMRNAAAAPPVVEPVAAEPTRVAPTDNPPAATVQPVVHEQFPTARKPESSEELAAAMAEFDKLFDAHDVPPLVEPPAPASASYGSAPVAAAPVAHDPIPEVVAPTPTPRAEATSSVPAVSVPPVSAPPTSVPPVSVPPAPAPESAGVDDRPAEPLREVISAPEVYAAPEGHWSNQVEIDERTQKSRGPHKRDISASDAITTSALVLPNFPVTSPITGPVSGTGQVLMTGSIDLPRSLGVNGLHPSRYDHPDIDSIIDAGDREDSAPDSAPVRAVRAVSTYTSSQGIIATKRPRGNNLPMVLSITAAVMMVGVVVLVVAGMIFKIF
jgi:hypothetical protein